jgi:hypothetical protein
MLNDAEDLNVGKPLHASHCDIRRPLTASAIETVTACATRGKHFFAAARGGPLSRGALFLAPIRLWRLA